MSWRMQGAALVAAALALLDPWQARADAAMDAKIEALVPDLEAYIAKGMADFHAPGVAIGIVSGDRLVWSEGFGVAWEGGPPVDAATVFQVGSTTKAFLATTLAIGVDRDKLAWDDRVVDLYPEFQLQDPVGDARVPGLRPAGAALGIAAVSTTSSASSASTRRR